MGTLRAAFVVGIVLLAFLSETEAQQKPGDPPLDEKGQIDRNNAKVKDLLIDNGLDETVSFRCGVFFAGKKYRDKPFDKLFILPKRFPINQTYINADRTTTSQDDSKLPKRYSNDASCPIKSPYGTAEFPSVHNDTCFNLFNGVTRRMKLEHDSFDGNEGKTIGDDTCQKLVDLGIKRLPPNKRFKKGVPIGFYYNTCTDKTWYDTGLRLPQMLCCKGGLSDPTYEACK